MIELYPRSQHKKSERIPFVLGLLSDFWRTLIMLLFLGFLSNFFNRKKITSQPPFLDFCVQFIDVIAHA